jgi:hypothetical protein
MFPKISLEKRLRVYAMHKQQKLGINTLFFKVCNGNYHFFDDHSSLCSGHMIEMYTVPYKRHPSLKSENAKKKSMIMLMMAYRVTLKSR